MFYKNSFISLLVLIISFSVFAKDKKEIYLDNNATTKCDPAVLRAMIPYFSEKYGNSGSITHKHGRIARKAIDNAREQVAAAINAKPEEIIFTSGATESNNIAIKGVARAYKKINTKNHLITVVTEHKCVLNSFKDLEDEGFKVTYLNVQKNGLLNLDDLKQAITPDTLLISVMTVNNEIGVIQDIKEIGKICKEKGVLFHTDAAQAIGKVPFDVSKLNVDLVSISGHKMYGPKGIGALYIRTGVEVEPLFSGGGQEEGIRSGTLPVPLCVGLGEAITIATKVLPEESKRILKIRNKVLNKITSSLSEVYLNGDFENRLPGNLNLTFAKVDLADLIKRLDGFAISAGSACTAESHISYVIKALDPEEQMPPASIRVCLGRFNTEEEAMLFADKVISVVKKLRIEKPDAGKRLCDQKKKSKEFLDSVK